MADKKYTAKQLRLTNEEIVEKFAVYGAEVDMVAKRQQASDRIVENIIAKLWRLEDDSKKRLDELEKAFKILCMVLSAACVITIILIYVF